MRNSSTQSDPGDKRRPVIATRRRQVMLQKIIFGASVFFLVTAMFGTIWHVRFGDSNKAYSENKKTEQVASYSTVSVNSNQIYSSKKNKNQD